MAPSPIRDIEAAAKLRKLRIRLLEARREMPPGDARKIVACAADELYHVMLLLRGEYE